MSKMLDKIVNGIKSFGLSAIKMFQERKQEDDVDTFEPGSQKGKVFATAETRVKELEQDEKQVQDEIIQALNNGTSTSEFQKSIKVSDVDYLDPNTKEGQELASAMRPIAQRLNDMENGKSAKSDDKSIGE